MENIINLIISGLVLGTVSLIFWQVKKGNGTSKTDHDDLIKLKTEFERMKEDWKEKHVDKAFDSAKRSHYRIDALEGKIGGA